MIDLNDYPKTKMVLDLWLERQYVFKDSRSSAKEHILRSFDGLFSHMAYYELLTYEIKLELLPYLLGCASSVPNNF